MKSSFVSPSRTYGLLAALLLVLPASAFAAPTQPIAEVENLGDTLVFQPHVSFAQLVLTVSGPCDFQYRQVVTRGEPFFQLSGETIDGSYSYNLVREEVVDPGVVKILLAARQADDPEVPKALCRDGKLPPPPVVQAEGFQVFEGSIIYDPFKVEQPGKSQTPPLESLSEASLQPMVAADFVINDDLIVDGSACIGFDCVNGESFGFDTIRLKENNLRIKFDDTSVAASFPRNDWQLTANDSANGGASKFSIDDISGARTPFTVEANARSHSLYVDDGGRIGSRTSTPSVEIHTIDGDTPTLRLAQDGSSGFTPQTWDVAGNETNFFVRDVTNGSALPLRIVPGSPSNAVFVASSGDVGMGTSAPDHHLDVEENLAGDSVIIRAHNPHATGNARVVMEAGGNNATFRTIANNGRDWVAGLASVNDRFELTKVGSGATEFFIDNNGDATISGTMYNTSDRASKTNIVPQNGKEILAALVDLPIATWSYKRNVEDRHLGPMSQDFHAAFGLGRDDLTISPLDASSVALSAIQALNEMVETLQKQNAELAARVAELEGLD